MAQCVSHVRHRTNRVAYRQSAIDNCACPTPKHGQSAHKESTVHWRFARHRAQRHTAQPREFQRMHTKCGDTRRTKRLDGHGRITKCFTWRMSGRIGRLTHFTITVCSFCVNCKYSKYCVLCTKEEQKKKKREKPLTRPYLLTRARLFRIHRCMDGKRVERMIAECEHRRMTYIFEVRSKSISIKCQIEI